MTIDRYKLYVKDARLSDEEITQLMRDVLEEIVLDTRIFTKPLGLVLSGCYKEYNMKEVFDLNQNLAKGIDSITYDVPSEGYIDDVLDVIYGTNRDCSRVNHVKTAVTQTPNLFPEKYLDTVDIVQLNKDGNELYSIIDEYFVAQTKDTFILRDGIIDDKKQESCVVLCQYVPRFDDIDEDMEMKLRPALIAGLRAIGAGLKLGLNDEQVTSMLNRNYYNAKRNLIRQSPVNFSIITKLDNNLE